MADTTVTKEWHTSDFNPETPPKVNTDKLALN